MKKLLALLLSAIMLLGLTACGTKEAPAPDGGAADGDTAQESSWPTDPITLKVTGKAGGSTDLVSRVFAEYYSKELSVPVVVENGEGILQYQGTHDADPDGYTMCVGAMGFLLYKHTGTLDFGLEGYDPISVVSEDETFGFYVLADAPYQTINELVDYMKAHPGELTFGMKTSTSVHLETVGFLEAVGCEANVVDAGGDANRVTALLGGQIDVTIEPYGSMKGYLDENEVICLGTFQEESCVLCPEIPTVYQQGIDFTFPTNFQALMLPVGCDQAVVEKASAAAQKVLDNPEYVAAINALGAIVNSRSYEEVNAYLGEADSIVTDLVQNIL